VVRQEDVLRLYCKLSPTFSDRVAELILISQVQASGPRPNTEFIASSLGPETTSVNGYVKVTPKLQLPSHPSIFAIGDIIDWPEQKQNSKTGPHTRIVVPNVLSFLADKEPNKEYKGTPEFLVMANGKVRLVHIVLMYVLHPKLDSFYRTPVLNLCPSLGASSSEELSWAPC
jgi:hypothetical protein